MKHSFSKWSVLVVLAFSVIPAEPRRGVVPADVVERVGEPSNVALVLAALALIGLMLLLRRRPD
ncbi:PEP-CTERM sorting domain-containing protein [Piscinibacter sp. HJYY11]|uniref:PEP-CTERM sorting domain-containing protein n=1 Tax=Piscinibacter sp. HJYY11 TaxID=2801333 RepID=UPI00191EC700|nr:PEP-CTERM sorting domain-containing protein [Piscinibacter sp. HJYY11]MBL0729272.1 PEP-CTERM sorting domain-containing protein [Piscinibacter sp. HJYY11]